MTTPATAAYMKAWYQKNRAKVLEQKRRGRINEPERFRGYDHNSDNKRRANPEHVEKRNRQDREKRAARNSLLPPRVNRSAFDSVTPESAYWIGFLMADGCVTDQGQILLQLSPVDAAHVLKFATFMGLLRAPYLNGGKSVITTKSKRLAAALIGFGVVPRKSKTAKVIGLENNRDFWRGVVDGDGCIQLLKRLNGYPTIGLCGSRALMDQFANYMATILDGRQQAVTAMKGIWSVGAAGTYAVRVIRELYDGCAVALDRKMERAQRAMAFQFRRKCSGPQAYTRTRTQGDQLCLF